MEQKEQVVVTPKVTVTVERGTEKSVASSEKAGVCFLLHDDSVEVVQAWSVGVVDLARIIDAVVKYGISQMEEHPGLAEIMCVLYTRREEKSLFSGPKL